MDYCIPRADTMPYMANHLEHGATKRNPLGAKGAGEAGTVGAICPRSSRRRRRGRAVGVKRLGHGRRPASGMDRRCAMRVPTL